MPMKMEPIETSETSATRTQTPGNYPKENTIHLKYGESLKSRILRFILPPVWRSDFCCCPNAETWRPVEPGFRSCCCLVHVVVVTQRFSSTYDGTPICRSLKLTLCVFKREPLFQPSQKFAYRSHLLPLPFYVVDIGTASSKASAPQNILSLFRVPFILSLSQGHPVAVYVFFLVLPFILFP